MKASLAWPSGHPNQTERHEFRFWCQKMDDPGARATAKAHKLTLAATFVAEAFEQPVDEGRLPWLDFRARFREREPLRPIDFGEGLLGTALWRPFKLELIGFERSRVEIAV